jgi:hypothetical protein
MKRTFSKLVAGTVLASLTMMHVVPAQSDAQVRSLVGSWRVSLTPRNCITGDALPAPGAPYQGFYTFHEGGTMSEWMTSLFVLPTARSPGHGAWTKTHGWQGYSYAIIFNRYDTLGNLEGTQRGRATLVLGESGNDYTATSRVQVFDLNGIPVDSGCSTLEATRYE